LKNVAKVIR